MQDEEDRDVTEQEIDVRETLAVAGHPVTLREISLASGVKLSTARGILKRMHEAGEVERDESDRYRMSTGETAPASESPVRSLQGEHDLVVRDAVRAHAGEEGLTITEVSGLVNLRRRVCENTLWRLETKAGELVSVGRPRRYRPASGE